MAVRHVKIENHVWKTDRGRVHDNPIVVCLEVSDDHTEEEVIELAKDRIQLDYRATLMFCKATLVRQGDNAWSGWVPVDEQETAKSQGRTRDVAPKKRSSSGAAKVSKKDESEAPEASGGLLRFI